MSVLGRATLELNADSAKLEQDLGRAVQQAATLGTAIGTAIGQGISAAGDKLVSMVTKAIETGDALEKMSQKTGIAVEALSEIRIAAELADVPMSALKQSIKQLSVNAVEALKNTSGESAKAFNAMGIDVSKYGGDTDKLFTAVMTKLGQYRDDTNKTALETKTLGRSGNELRPLQDELQKSRNFARELGLTMDSETSAAATRFKDNIKIASLASEAMGQRIAAVLLPSMEKLSGALVDNAKNTERLDAVTRVADAGLKLFATAGTVVATVFGIAGDKIGAAFATASLVLKGEFSEAARTAGGTVVATGQKIGEAVAEIQGIWDGAANKAEAGAAKNGEKLAAAATEATKRIKAARKEADTEFQAFLKIQAIEGEAGKATQDYYREEGRLKEEVRAKEIADRELMMQQVYAFGEAQEEAAMKAEQIAAGIGDAASKVKETNDFASQMGMTFSSAFEAAVFGGNKFSDVLKGLIRDIAKMALMKAVSGMFGGGGGGGMDWGAVMGVGQAALALEEGTDYVPRTGYALLHEGEAVVPASENRKGDGPVTIINQTSGRIDKVVERRMSNGERVLLLQESVEVTAAQLADPNSRISRAMARNFPVQRSR